jgi:hypothetical protein
MAKVLIAGALFAPSPAEKNKKHILQQCTDAECAANDFKQGQFHKSGSTIYKTFIYKKQTLSEIFLSWNNLPQK